MTAQLEVRRRSDSIFALRRVRFVWRFVTCAFALAFALTCRSDFDPPEVVASYPTQNADGIPNSVEVWVEFSEPMDNSQTETAFSLFADGDRPKGQFVWQGNRLRFVPRGPLVTGRTYTMLVGKAAEDSSGNNLRDDFQINFTVNPDAGKPYIVSTTPTYGQTGVLPTDVLTFVFSEAVNPSTLIPGITITPSVVGNFTVNGTGETVTFTPQSNLLNGTVYTVNINTGVQDLAGNSILQGRTISFVVGTDFVRPTILSALGNSSGVTLQNGLITPLISKNDQIVITFDELMNTTALPNAITISPTAGFTKTFTTLGISTVATLTFSPPLESETLYTLSISNAATDVANNILNQNYNYQFTTNAADTIRPQVIGVRQAIRAINSGVCSTSLVACSSGFGSVCPLGPTDVCNHQGGPSEFHVNELVGAVPAVYPAPPLAPPPAPPGTVRAQNDTIEIAEQIDSDPNAILTKMRIVLNVYFTQQMNLSSLVQATSFTPIISGTGIVDITDIKMDGTLTMMRVYISGWNGTGYYKLRIAGGVARDNAGNFLLNDYVLFTN